MSIPFRILRSRDSVLQRTIVEQFLIFISIVLMTMAMAGCQTLGGSGQIYTFRNLPSELVAVRRENVQTLELDRLARTSIGSDVIDYGDQIEVVIVAGLDEKDTVKVPVTVGEDGVGRVSEIGPIRLAGLDTLAAEAAIYRACVDQQIYLNPNIAVSMKKQRTNRVTVIGAVKSPKTYFLPRSQCNLLSAIVAAEGLEKDAGTIVEIQNPMTPQGSRSNPIASGTSSNINTVSMNASSEEIEKSAAVLSVSTNNGMKSIRVNLVSAVKEAKQSFELADGATVRVEKRDLEPLHVEGLVRKPNRYEFPVNEEVRVTEAISLAGGTSVSVADKIFVVRRKPNGTETVVIKTSLKEAKRNSNANVLLSPGDLVSVEQTPATVMMEVLNIVRFGISSAVPFPGL